MVKMTFTFDETTVESLRKAADRLKKPQSVVVREAIQEYANRTHLLSDSERRRMLSVLERMGSRSHTGDAATVDEELKGLRRVRRTGGRRSPVE